MKVYGRCENCLEDISYSTSARTRVEFAMAHNESVGLFCKGCNKNSAFHVDQLFTKPSKIAQLCAAFIFFFGTPLFYILINQILTESRSNYVIYVIGGFLIVPVLAFTIINKQDQTRVSDFNRRKLKGRIHNI